MSTFDHVEYTTWSTGNDVLTCVEFSDVFSDRGSSDAGVTLNVHVVCRGVGVSVRRSKCVQGMLTSESENDGLNLSCEFSRGREDECLSFPERSVDGLEDGDGEGRGFTGSGLSLRDHVSSLGDGQNRSLLDS